MFEKTSYYNPIVPYLVSHGIYYGLYRLSIILRRDILIDYKNTLSIVRTRGLGASSYKI